MVTGWNRTLARSVDRFDNTHLTVDDHLFPIRIFDRGVVGLIDSGKYAVVDARGRSYL